MKKIPKPLCMMFSSLALRVSALGLFPGKGFPQLLRTFLTVSNRDSLEGSIWDLKKNLAMSAYQYFDIQQNPILLTLPALLTSKLRLLSDQKSKELPYSEVCVLFRHSRASHALILQMQSLRLSLFLVSLSTESLNHCDNYFLCFQARSLLLLLSQPSSLHY